MKKLTNLLLSILIFSVLLLLTNCATIIKGEKEKITFNTNPEGTKVLVNGIERGKTPLTLELESNKKHTIKYIRETNDPIEFDIEGEINAKWVILDVLSGTISGFLPLIIDASTEAWYELDKAVIPIALFNINFVTGSDEVKKESYKYLKEVASYMKDNPQKQLHISGHTDNTGGKDYNQSLSENRAKSVKTILVKYGVSPDRITTSGHNFSKPIDTNETQKGRSNNRRVEFKFSN